MRKYENTGSGDQIPIENVGQYYAAPSMPRDPVLVNLLSRVRTEVKARLDQSLHRAVDAELLNLGKVLEPHQVRNRWIMEEKSIQTHPPTPLPPEMTIAEVFELPKVGQELLILGEPGSGKTTTLLELTQNLVEKALEDTNAPIPVLVNLSSWKDPQQKIFDWLLEELKSKYGLRQELGGQFLRQNQLLSCLDGLDEVASIRQEACVVKLNEWLVGNAEQRSMGVVVCCRREQYEKIVRKLFLENCVALQPLSDAQIETYLTQFQVGAAWKSVQASSKLQNLLRKPLFLRMFGFVTPQFDFEEWQQRTTDDERMEYLFDRYWDVAMDRPLVDAKSQDDGILSKTYRKKKLPDHKKVRRALVFAAQAMEQESQTELLIERMQPSWLRNRNQKQLYWLFCKLSLGLVVGLFLGILIALFFGWFYKGVIALIGGITLGFLGEIDCIDTVESLRVPASLFEVNETLRTQRRYILAWLIGGSAIFVIMGPRTVLILWLIFGLIFLLTSFFKKDITKEYRIKSNQGIKNTFQNLIFLTTISFVCAIILVKLLEYFLTTLLLNSKILEISIIVFFALIISAFYVGGGKTILQHISLRIVLALNGYAPYRYDKLLDYCAERLLLQRIGGRYRFMHKLLQEHFAKMPLD
jgi:DNA polymerase III delta prime subunit